MNIKLLIITFFLGIFFVNTGKGAITISASGGSSPYYYMLDDETFDNGHPFTSPATLFNIEEGNHKIKVIDSQSCEEK